MRDGEERLDPVSDPDRSGDREHLLGWLAMAYDSATAVRALWTWAGIAAHEIDHAATPALTWAALIGQLGDAPAQRTIDLLRQALFDHPGAGAALDVLQSLAAPEDLRRARGFVQRFGALPPDALAGALTAAMAAPATPVAFEALAPALQRRLDAAARAALGRLLSTMTGPGPGALPLLDALRATEAAHADHP